MEILLYDNLELLLHAMYMDSKSFSADKVLQQAIELATTAHNGQKRASGLDYITHPLAVMAILKELNFPEIALAAAVLHDVCEDTYVTNIDVSKEFPSRVSFIVYSLSKNLKPTDNNIWRDKYKNAKKRKEEQTSTFEEYIDYSFTMYMRRFYLGCVADPYVMYIKMADQIHNLSDMGSLTEKKKKRKIMEVEKFFLPLYEKMEELVTKDCSYQYADLYHQLEKIIKEIKST